MHVQVEVLVTPLLQAFPKRIRGMAMASAGCVMFLMWYGIALLAIALAAGLQREDEGKRKKWVITVAWTEQSALKTSPFELLGLHAR